MKKIICTLLAVLSCCLFSAAAGAEGVQPDAGAADATTSLVETSEESTTQPTTTTTTRVPSAQTFTGSVRLMCDTAPTNKPVTVTAAVEGGTLAEGDVVRYRMYSGTVSEADADPNVQWVDYTAPFEVPANTKIEAAVFFADGSRSASISTEITCIDMIEPVAPEIKASTTDWTRDPVLVTVSGGSDDQSGLLRLEYRTGAEGTWTEYTGDISIASPTAVYARSVDAAGNVSVAAVLEVNNFDMTPPDESTLAVALSASGKPVVADSGAFGKYFGSDVTVAIDGATDDASGVKSYQYQIVSGTDSLKEDKWQTYDPKKPPVVKGDFCGYVYARAVDGVGNCSAPVSSEGFVVDVTAPVVKNIKLSETAVTGNRVIVTFNVEDNYWLETVTVNGVYAGVYVSSFTAFRNDDYLIVAFDKVGNRTEELVQITNINTTPFTLLDTWKNMDAKDFTPTTWATAEKAANELQTLITVEAPQAQVEAAAGRLLTALEGLVTRGDGTLSRELIDRITAYDKTMYTESSWAIVEESIAQLESCLDNPESTQEEVDINRRNLEQKLTELVKLADFTDLDRLIAQGERMNSDDFTATSYKSFAEALEAAKNLSRTDSSQSQADEAYQLLLAVMGALESSDKKAFDPAPIVFVVLGLLIVAAGTALLIVRMRTKNTVIDTDEDESAGETAGYGDICFTDDSEPEEEPAGDDSDDTAYESTYIGGRSSADRK